VKKSVEWILEHANRGRAAVGVIKQYPPAGSRTSKVAQTWSARSAALKMENLKCCKYKKIKAAEFLGCETLRCALTIDRERIPADPCARL